MSFPAYPKYKDSGAAWLGDVPNHWEVIEGRRLFAQRREPAKPEDQQLSATQRYGVIPQALFMTLEDQKVTLALSGVDNFRHVQRDDFVISLRSFQGGIERSAFTGCVSPAYTVLRPSRQNPRYWAYVLKSSGFVAALQTVTDGIRDGKTVSYEQFGALRLPTPDQEEQVAIATFLDRETAKIDGLVEEQKRLIELLKEKRQAVISQAVTKGLDSTVPMKDSGVEWLGQVPAHWPIARLGYYATVENGATPSRDSPKYWLDGQVPWLASGEVNKLHIFEADEHISQAALDECSLRLLPVNTVIVGLIGQGKTRGMSALLHAPATINQNLAAVCPGDGIDSWYLLYTFHAMYEWLREAGRGGNQAAMNCEMLRSLRVPVPRVDEQTRIAASISAALEKIDALSCEAESAMELLQERRFALISAAVTGKIDVRGLVPIPEAAPA